MAKGYYDVLVRVISARGTCANGHKVGDEWIFGSKTPEGLCLSALGSLLVFIRVLSFGGTLPWSDDPDAGIIACPDGKNSLRYELRRLR